MDMSLEKKEILLRKDAFLHYLMNILQVEIFFDSHLLINFSSLIKITERLQNISLHQFMLKSS